MIEKITAQNPLITIARIAFLIRMTWLANSEMFE